MKKPFLLLMAAALLLLTGCSDKKPAFCSPQIIASDQTEYTLPLSELYPLSPEHLSEGAELISQAAGCPLDAPSLNTVWFGENIFGTGLASVVYFGKYAQDLEPEEWELLARIAGSPNDYTEVLTGSQQIEGISPYAQYASRIPDNAYFDAMVEEIVTDIAASQNCTREKAFRLLYAEGVTIETPFSPSMQTAVDTVYEDDTSFAERLDVFPQSACAVCDLHGNMLAVGAGNHGNTAYNRAFRTLHPIGSSIKPLAVYTPALMQNLITFSTVIDDEPVLNPGTPEEWPHNYNRLYEGPVTVTYALRQSKNTVPVKICQELHPDVCYAFLRDRLGFTTLTPTDISVYAMALGYLDKGVSLTELTAAYQIYGNGGTYTAPHFYTRVTDGNGSLLTECKPETTQVLEPADAWIMNRLLCNTIAMDDGIAQAARLEDGSEVCGKTGTVDNSDGKDTDRLFAGLTPEYCAAVWIGFDQRDAAIEPYDYQPPAAVWKRIMELADRTETAFTPDPSVIAADFCTQSGELAGDSCPDTETGYYREDALPGICSYHNKG